MRTASDTIEAQAKALEAQKARLVTLENTVSQNRTDLDSMLENVNLILGMLESLKASSSGAMVVSSSTTDLEKALTDLQKEVKVMKERAAAQRLFVLGGGAVCYDSEEAFLAAVNSLPPNIFEIFGDPITLLAMMTTGVVKTEDIQRDELHEQKVQRSKYQSIYLGAAQSIYPSILVGTGNSDLMGGRITLHAIRSYTLFNKNNGVEGLATRIRKALPDTRRMIELRIVEALPDLVEMQILAKYLLSKSVDFVLSAFQFAETMRTELLVHGHGDGPYSATAEKEVWELVLLMLTAMFDTLWITRGEASQAHLSPARANEIYLRAALKTHMEMERFVAKSFSEHEAIAPKLQRYIFETFVSKSDFVDVRDTVSELQSEFKGLKRSFDSLSGQVLNGGGGGGDGGDGGAPNRQRRKQKRAEAKAKEDAEK